MSGVEPPYSYCWFYELCVRIMLYLSICISTVIKGARLPGLKEGRRNTLCFVMSHSERAFDLFIFRVLNWGRQQPLLFLALLFYFSSFLSYSPQLRGFGGFSCWCAVDLRVCAVDRLFLNVFWKDRGAMALCSSKHRANISEPSEIQREKEQRRLFLRDTL